MSKQTSKKFIILPFILLVAFAPLPVFAIFHKPQKFLISQQVNPQNSPIPVVFPRVATVTLKGEQKKSGRLINSNGQSQTITLYNDGKEDEIIKTADLKEINFSGEAILKDGTFVIRGEDKQNRDNNAQYNWTESLNNFRITDNKTGKAEITLTSVKPDELRRIIADAKEKDTDYIIKKMQFNSPQEVTITLEKHRNRNKK